MVDICNTRHDDERKVVKEPANHRVDTSIVNLVNFALVKVLEAALPSENVPNHNEANETQRDGGAPVDKGVTQKEVLDNVVVPAAHAQTDM